VFLTKTAKGQFGSKSEHAAASAAGRKSSASATSSRSVRLLKDPEVRVQLATIQALARYWATDYDWRKIEAKMNTLPQFMTEIDGLDIHFITFGQNTKMRCR
jgi:hypothetical protein